MTHNSPKNLSAIIFLFKKGWHYAKGMRGTYILYISMFVLAQAISVSQPYFIGLLLNSVQTATTPAETLENVIKYSLIVFGVLSIFWLLHYPARVLEMRTAFKIRINFREDLFKKLLALPLAWHQDNPTGDSIDRINRSTLGLHSFLSSAFQVLYALTEFVVVIIILLIFMPSAGLICIIASFTLFMIISLFDFYLNKDFKELNSYENKISSAIHDYISNIVTIVALRIAPLVKKEFSLYLTKPESLYRNHTVRHELKWFAFSLTSNLVLFGVPIWYAYNNYINNQMILVGTFYTLFDYLRRLNATLFSFSWLYGVIIRQVADVKNANNIELAYEAVLPSLNEKIIGNWQNIQIKDLNFIYQKDLNTSGKISDLNLNIKSGQKIAVVGSSGSGKSTLLNILGGLHESAAGQVLVDSNQSSLQEVVKITALIPQSPEIFIETIKFNVTFGIETNTDDVNYYCNLACFNEVVERLPKGLESHIAEKGVNLSGGERQRLALARGLYLARNANILLLDEATSSVDPYNERRIYENIWNEYKDKTIIATIHRLHLLEMFDYIYVLSNGRVVEEGTLKKLQELEQGELSKLYRAYKE
jgi:ABC-type multidrug transport system fused ATPase/permease subunit